jgi:hypothetical protein
LVKLRDAEVGSSNLPHPTGSEAVSPLGRRFANIVVPGQKPGECGRCRAGLLVVAVTRPTRFEHGSVEAHAADRQHGCELDRSILQCVLYDPSAPDRLSTRSLEGAVR